MLQTMPCLREPAATHPVLLAIECSQRRAESSQDAGSIHERRFETGARRDDVLLTIESLFRDCDLVCDLEGCMFDRSGGSPGFIMVATARALGCAGRTAVWNPVRHGGAASSSNRRTSPGGSVACKGALWSSV